MTKRADELLDQLNSVVSGNERDFIATGRLENLEQHLLHVKREFSGQPAINYTFACCIVKIRRQIEPEDNRALFLDLVHHPIIGPFLAQHLSLRWLVSAADTLADIGNAQEAGAAMNLVVLINMMKLAETEYRLCGKPEHQPQQLAQLLEQHPVALFEGMIYYHPIRGDMPRNMFQRLRRSVSSHAFLERVFARALQVVQQQPNLLQRLAVYNEGFFSS